MVRVQECSVACDQVKSTHDAHLSSSVIKSYNCLRLLMTQEFALYNILISALPFEKQREKLWNGSI
jgi:hypothetical protein